MSPVQSFAIDHPLSLLALNVFGDQIGLPVPSYPSLVLAGGQYLVLDGAARRRSSDTENWSPLPEDAGCL